MINENPLFDVTGEHVYEGGIYQRRLVVDERYMQLFAFLQTSRLLKTKQLESLFVDYFGNSINDRTMRKRLNKFVEYDVLASKQLDYGVGAQKYNVYRLGDKGAELLQDYKLLEANMDSNHLYSLFSKTNYDHYLATQEMLIRTLTGAKAYQAHNDVEAGQVFTNLHSINPSSHPYLDMESKSVLLTPDWIIKSNNKLLSIECDSGTEVQRHIVDKLERYMTLAHYYKDEEHHVLFGIIDKSFPTRIAANNNRSRRVSNIKQLIIELPGFINSNLNLQVISMERTKQVGPRPLMLQPLTEDNRKIRMKVFYRSLARKADYPFSLTKRSKDIEETVLTAIKEQVGIKPDYIVEEEGTASSPSLSVFFMLREGDVKSLARLKSLSNESTIRILNAAGIPVKRVYGVYYDHDELIYDNVPINCDEHVFFSSIKSLAHPGCNTGIYKRLTKTRVQEVGYE
ncbi:replication-relaxation family protein [Pontibacillus halophilus]|uniref:replication-relaxation family protein n=1 Tax=Pontibacillus halophilus TaxID=516704 RepID=UPI0003F69AE7|nr:replication-relaxation family protein [Pontibacillus halophilus]